MVIAAWTWRLQIYNGKPPLQTKTEFKLRVASWEL